VVGLTEQAPERTAASRRALLAGALAVGAAAGPALADAPAVPGLEFALELTLVLGAPQTPGQTPYGRRNLTPITGGRFEGPRIRGEVLPGADWQLVRPDGVTTLEVEYMLKAEDGALIHVFNHGLAVVATGAAPYLRGALAFEAPIGPHDWLNKAVFLATMAVTREAGAPPSVHVRAYKVL
jgi:hypothetical protein